MVQVWEYKGHKVPPLLPRLFILFITNHSFITSSLLTSPAQFKMLYSTLSVLVLAIGASAIPAPAVNVVGNTAFSAPAVHNHNFQRNGTAAMLKAYAKHHLTPTREMPAEFLAALQKRQDGSATAFPSDGVEYLVTTSVGGQNLNLDFDTGSADL